MENHPKTINYEDVFTSIFVIMFGAFAAGQASAFGPDVIRARTSAMKIFKITDVPSEIDVLNDVEDFTPIDEAKFRGKIEFREVWFRYPTRPTEWVF